MKVRSGFVSNSSSASFIISTNAITPKQLKQLKNYLSVGRRLNRISGKQKYYIDPDWNIIEEDNKIVGFTSMDNFGMDDFLEEIGIPPEISKYEGGGSSQAFFLREQYMKFAKG